MRGTLRIPPEPVPVQVVGVLEDFRFGSRAGGRVAIVPLAELARVRDVAGVDRTYWIQRAEGADVGALTGELRARFPELPSLRLGRRRESAIAAACSMAPTTIGRICALRAAIGITPTTSTASRRPSSTSEATRGYTSSETPEFAAATKCPTAAISAPQKARRDPGPDARTMTTPKAATT